MLSCWIHIKHGVKNFIYQNGVKGFHCLLYVLQYPRIDLPQVGNSTIRGTSGSPASADLAAIPPGQISETNLEVEKCGSEVLQYFSITSCEILQVHSFTMLPCCSYILRVYVPGHGYLN